MPVQYLYGIQTSDARGEDRIMIGVRYYRWPEWEEVKLRAYLEYCTFRQSGCWGERWATECISWPPSPQQIMATYPRVINLWTSS